MTIKNKDRDVLLAIDANAIVHRAFHAYPPTLQTEEGLQVNAVYGFTVMLLEALKIFGPKYVLCAMDTHVPTFRHTMYTEYKATRKPTDLSLIDQFPLVEEVLKAFNIPVLKKDGFEADDILGTISRYVSEGVWSSENVDLYILSGDRDLLQLINDRTNVCLPNGNFKNIVLYDREKTFEKFGYYPEQVTDYKAIVGDASDNIPGVKGVGEKTAVELLKKYQTLDDIYKNINDIPGRFKTLLVEGIEQAEFSRELATIDRNVDIKVRLTECILKDLDRRELESVLKKYSFKSLLGRLDDIFGKEIYQSNQSQLDMFGQEGAEYVWSTELEIENEIENAKKVVVGYISREESLDRNDFLCLRVTYKDSSQKDFLCKPFDILNPLDGKETTFYNFEEFVTYSKVEVDEKLNSYYDISLAEHLLHSEKRYPSIRDFAFEYSTKVLNEKLSPMYLSNILSVIEDSQVGQLKKFDNLELYDYTKKSIETYLNIHDRYLPRVLTYIELPISVILSRMESRGIALDWEKLNKLKEDVEKEVANATKEIYSIVGHEFNINSPKQLSDVLYKELNLPNSSKNSTRESILDGMLGMHPIIEHLLYFREITKIQSTYVEPLYQNSKKDIDGKYAVHTDFKQMGTTSGRFSSVSPNMQNLPLDGAWAKRVRECFVARDGYKLLGMDYSQMELRIMADISNDKLLTQDFINGLDIHTTTAARVLDKKMADITHKERNLGKTVNFGMIFGQTAFGLSRLLGVDRDAAWKYIQSYFENYKGVEEYMRKIEYEAFEKGYVQTMFGTTRNISGIRSKNVRMRAAAAREAINMPIQGSEADIMKLIMKNLYDLIEEKYPKDAYILLQIHDEIVFEVKESRIEEFSLEAKKIMCDSVTLDVPFDVHISIGKALSDLK